MFLNRKWVIAAMAACVVSSVYADTSDTQATGQNQATMQSTDAATTSTATPAMAKVDINKATMSDLMKVKGMDKKKAKNIISYRKKHGDFKSLDDLKNVAGFKKMKDEDLKAIQDQLTLG